MRRGTPWRIALVAFMAALLGAGLATPASAHTALRKSTPAKGAKVASLQEATLEFTENISAEFVTVQLRDAGGGRHESGRPEVKGPVVTQQVSGALAPGAYSVVYRVISADGHPVEGRIRFTITGGSTPQPTEAGQPSQGQAAADPATTPVASPSDDPGSGPLRQIVLGVVLLAVIGTTGGVLLLRRRKTQP